ncbi:unnamed protein product [Rotaria socialis]|uniref:EF-hand domain-containing protein 1 n=1 Tax=Rotaria socialis TaxID=392032 RepID=A0A820BN31_9BILA|nr:unnamed protein product [Rotaria socialis]CAF3639132.1 unnamed protein product [Rotaria socialis]CAF4201291.1 unnamed protein product [Rotaria socialis]CAF4204460.1 unnamed protein product [Rotaria socialis]
MEGLPCLPGNSFRDPTQTNFHVSHTLDVKNGHRVTKWPQVGLGGTRINYNQISEDELELLRNYRPELIYGKSVVQTPDKFVPATLAFDKKVLRFFGYFKQTIHESPNEYYRVRPIKILYYLEDDSLEILEEVQENSGIPQGKLLRRHRFPKNDQGETYNFRDINLGQNLSVYGKVFRVCDCDAFTREWLESEGIHVSQSELIPRDPYISKRIQAAELKTYKTKTDFDKLKQYIEMDRKVLRFYAVWDDRSRMFGEKREFVIQYFLVNDTMEIREVHQANDGRDPFPVLITRHKIPKDRYDVKGTFPHVFLELSETEVANYFKPSDLMVGKTVNIYGRNFLIHDCDMFTKTFYAKNFGVNNFEPVDVQETRNEYAKMEIPPYNGFGSLEDSMQNCLRLQPERPKKDYVKLMENDHRVLRYEAVLDSPREDDRSRKFIISYRLGDDTITIHEPPQRNSGMIGGRFLERTRVSKPGSTLERPQFYGPCDFYIGATVEVFRQRFVICSADLFVLKYAEEHPEQFTPAVIESLRQHLSNETGRPDARLTTNIRIQRRPGDFIRLYAEVRNKLKHMRITNHEEIRQMFLRYDKDRSGFVTRENIMDLFRQINLPLENDLIDAMVAECTTNSEGKINLYDFLRFFDS